MPQCMGAWASGHRSSPKLGDSELRHQRAQAVREFGKAIPLQQEVWRHAACNMCVCLVLASLVQSPSQICLWPCINPAWRHTRHTHTHTQWCQEQDVIAGVPACHVSRCVYLKRWMQEGQFPLWVQFHRWWKLWDDVFSSLFGSTEHATRGHLSSPTDPLLTRSPRSSSAGDLKVLTNKRKIHDAVYKLSTNEC